MKIKLALVQFKTELYQVEKNIIKAEKFIKEAAAKGTDIIAFPEEFLTGTLRLRKDLIDSEGKLVKIFSSLAKKYSIDIQAGSWYIKKGNKLHNAAYYFDKKGKVLGEYYKNHLWHTEKPYSTPGNKVPVFQTRFGRIAMSICWDLIYPETFRSMLKQKADLALVPALWSREDAGNGIKLDYDAEVKLVNALVTARAIENQMHVAFINGAGQFSVNNFTGHLIGRTQVASPFLGTVARINSNAEKVLYATIDNSILPIAEESYKIREDLSIE